MRTRALRRALVAAAAPLALAACGVTGTPAPRAENGQGGAKRPRNVVLISIDTLRADRLGSYGYNIPTSPNFDAFAARSVRFTDCLAASGHTLASHKAMLSGRSASAFLSAYSSAASSRTSSTTGSPAGPLAYYQEAFHGWASPSLAERLRNAGLATCGLTDGGFMRASFGFTDGFDRYRSERLGLARQRSDAEAWIRENQARPFFLFLHCYDVHCPYNPPAPFLRKVEDRCEGRLRFEGTCGKDYFNLLDLTGDEKRHIGRHYDAGILHADDELGRFIDSLEKDGRLADTLIVITSDHGESLGEREFVGHGELFENQLRVPLVIYAPGQPPGVVTTPVSGVDVAPTILDLVTGSVPEGLDGWSLRALLVSSPDLSVSSSPHIAGSPAPARSVGPEGKAGPVTGGRPSHPHTAEDFDSRPRVAAITVNEGRGNVTRLRKIAVREGRGFKLILDAESGDRSLFDLAADPQESRNLAGRRLPDEKRLAELAERQDPGSLAGYRPSVTRPGNKERLSPEEREELKSLGYVH